MSPLETLVSLDAALEESRNVTYIRYSHGEYNHAKGKGAMLFDCIPKYNTELIEGMNLKHPDFFRGINGIHELDENMGPGVFKDTPKQIQEAKDFIRAICDEENLPDGEIFHSGICFQYCCRFALDQLRAFLRKWVTDQPYDVLFIGSIPGSKMAEGLQRDILHLPVPHRNAHENSWQRGGQLLDILEGTKTGIILSAAGFFTKVIGVWHFKSGSPIPFLDIGSAANAIAGCTGGPYGKYDWIPEDYTWSLQ